MLELARVSAAHGHHAAVHMQLADDRHASFELRAEGLRGAAAQPQQANQDVLLRILIGQERLPAAVGHIVSPYQLHLPQTSVLAIMFLEGGTIKKITIFTPVTSDWGIGGGG